MVARGAGRAIDHRVARKPARAFRVAGWAASILMFWFGVAPVMADAPAAPPLVAVVAPQAGPFQLLGQALVAGVTFAARNSARSALSGTGTTGVRVETFDDNCDPARMPAILQSLERLRPQLVIGSLCYRTSRLLAGAASRLGAVYISPVVGDPRLAASDGGPQVFSLASAPSVVPAMVADRAAMLAAGKGPVVLIDDGTLVGHGLTSTVADLLKARNQPTSPPLTYTRGASDLSAVAGQIARGAPAVIVAGGSLEDIGRLADLLAAMPGGAKVKPRILSGDGLVSATASGPGAAASTIEFVGPADPRLAADATRIVTPLTVGGLPPAPLAVVGAEAVTLYAAAVSATGSTAAEAVAATMHRMVFDTPFGPLSFEANGQLRGGEKLAGYVWWHYRGGVAVPLDGP